MKRNVLYFLSPDTDTARRVVDELLLARVSKSRIHVVARDQDLTAGLPRAGLSKRTDIIPALERGLTLGAISGLIVGAFVAWFDIGWINAEAMAVLALGVAGALFGMFAASLYGVAVPNSQLHAYHEAIDRGHPLVLAEVDAADASALLERIAQQVPNIDTAQRHRKVHTVP